MPRRQIEEIVPAPWFSAGNLARRQPIPRSEIDRLLLDKLPEVLNEKQKKAKVHNLMAELARKGRIENRGSRGHPAWHTVDQPAV